MRWVIFIILAVVLGIILFLMFRKKKKPQEQFRDLSQLSIKDARIGDTVSLRGHGDDYEDADVRIERIHRYDADGDEWFELVGRYKGRVVFIEWYEDDLLEVSAAIRPQTLRLQDLGLTEDDLVRFDDQGSTQNSFEFDGRFWQYEDSYEAVFYEDKRGGGEGFYCWDFAEEDGEGLLSIEKWEGEDFEACPAVHVAPGDVTVYRA